jgi:ribosomal protein S30
MHESSTKAGKIRKLEAKDPRKRATRPYSFRKERKISSIIKITKAFYLN